MPGNVGISCEWIAKLKGVAVEEVMEATRRNALRLFTRLKR